MARKNKIPWLEYAGQDTAEILACKGTHRIDSLLCVKETGSPASCPQFLPTGTEILKVDAIDKIPTDN